MTDVIDQVLLLSKVEAFSQLTTEQLSLLGLIAEALEPPPGSVIYDVGDPPNGMYLVVSGRVRLERDGVLVASLGAGEDFGTWALFDPQPRVTTAKTEAPTQLLRIDRQYFEDLVEDHPELAHGLFRSLARRVRTLTEIIETTETRRSLGPWL
jgi:CRP/FNR family cyclic AMP-dependent transcriptional regulator